MLSSPRRPVRTMRIFSSAENWRRVTRRISFTTCSAGSFTGPDFCPICAPSMATMGQKSSLPQLTRSVSVVLTPDTLHCDEHLSLSFDHRVLRIGRVAFLLDLTKLGLDQVQ